MAGEMGWHYEIRFLIEIHGMGENRPRAVQIFAQFSVMSSAVSTVATREQLLNNLIKGKL